MSASLFTQREFLQRHRAVGGLALPNLRNYYWATNVRKMTLWIQGPTLSWCESEAKCPLPSYLTFGFANPIPMQPNCCFNYKNLISI